MQTVFLFAAKFEQNPAGAIYFILQTIEKKAIQHWHGS
jgi:hypothetical protein